MADTFNVNSTGPDDPFIGAVVIDYSGGDQTISIPARGIYIGTAGALKVDLANGTTATFSGMLAGHVYRVCVTKVYQTGSTAAGLVLR